MAKCPDCGSVKLQHDEERAEVICKDCGSVLEDNMVDFGPEWRAFDSDQRAKRQRTGAPIKYTKPNKGLVTEIDRYNRDIRGSKISPQSQAQRMFWASWVWGPAAGPSGVPSGRP